MGAERGATLPVALGMMMVLGLSSVLTLELSSSAQRSATRDRSVQSAVAAAEAGINHAASVLANASDPDSPTALPPSTSPGTIAIDGATVRYSGSLDTTVAPHVWTVTSVGTTANLGGGSPLSRTVTAKYQVAPGGMSLSGNEAWKYVFSAQTSPCLVLQNSVVVRAPLYTRGDLCLKNGARAVGPNVDVRGSITIEEGPASIGTDPADSNDPAVRAGLGCRYTTAPSPSTSACTSSNYVYLSSYSSVVPDHVKPPVDLAHWRANAKLGPGQPCTTTSGPVPSFTSTGAVDLLPAASYTCEVWQSGDLVARLSWDSTSRTLSVKGVVYFDGGLLLDNSQQGTYDGKGTLYFGQKSFIRNSAKLCAIADCVTTGWDPNAELLTLVVGSADEPAFELNNFAKFQGAVYVVGGFILQNNATMQGPVVADVIETQNSGLSTAWTQLTSLSEGMPTNGGGPATVTPVAGSWRG